MAKIVINVPDEYQFVAGTLKVFGVYPDSGKPLPLQFCPLDRLLVPGDVVSFTFPKPEVYAGLYR